MNVHHAKENKREMFLKGLKGEMAGNTKGRGPVLFSAAAEYMNRAAVPAQPEVKRRGEDWGQI